MLFKPSDIDHSKWKIPTEPKRVIPSPKHSQRDSPYVTQNFIETVSKEALTK